MSDTTSTFLVGQLPVEVYPDEDSMGRSAARSAASTLREAIAARGRARVVIATGNSQYSFIEALVREDIEWGAVTVLHMDEYIGISKEHPASFQRWIRERVADRVHPSRVEYISGSGDPEVEAARYEALLREAPLDLVCMGIGENGHLAFNEPNDANFSDKRWARIVTLNAASRRQQVNEGHFPNEDSVPRQAISLTIPALLSAARVQVCVPEERKARAVLSALHDPVSVACPATILQESPHAVLYLEPRSASLLTVGK